MGNTPSKDFIPMPDQELYLSLLQEGFIFFNQNGDQITSDQVSSLQTQENGMVNYKMPENYGLFETINRTDLKRYYICDNKGNCIAELQWQNKIYESKKINSIIKLDIKQDLTGFELVDNEFKLVQTNFTKYIDLLNRYYDKQFKFAGQDCLDALYVEIKKMEKDIPVDEMIYFPEYRKLKAKIARSSHEAYMMSFDSCKPFKYTK